MSIRAIRQLADEKMARSREVGAVESILLSEDAIILRAFAYRMEREQRRLNRRKRMARARCGWRS